MIIFLYGPDGYRLKQNLDNIIQEYNKKYSGLSLAVLDLSDPSVGSQIKKLEDIVKTVSFFDEKRLVVIRNAFTSAEEMVDLIKTWKLDSDKQRILVFVENQNGSELAKKDKDLFAVLSGKLSGNLVKVFDVLEGKQLENWIVKEFKHQAGTEIDLSVVRELISRAGSDTWRLGQEINKLANFNNNITVDDVKLLITAQEDLSIFQTIDAIAGRNKMRAVVLLNDQIEAGADPYYIFSMIVYQFRNLLRVKDLMKNAVPYSNIVTKTSLNPYVVKKTYEQCKKYELDELKSLFAKLLQIEVTAKSGKASLEDELHKFVFYL